MEKIGNRIHVTVAACGLALLLGAPAHAADASPWVEDNYSGIRLIAGANKSGAESLGAGIEIKMQPGWHTYWRYPGDSGVPPRFSFAGSDNLASATVLFPAPHAFTDEAGTTIGYKGNVILPVSVVPRQKDKPVTLRAKIDYAVCEKLCVPAEARLELTIARSLPPGRCAASIGTPSLVTRVNAFTTGPLILPILRVLADRVRRRWPLGRRGARAAAGFRRRGRIDRAPRQ